MKENLKSLKHKLISVLLFFIISFSARATNYYLAASGNDGNNGTSSSTPWQTINRLNIVLGSLHPGDNIFFNRGDIFYGGLTINSSGASGNPIKFGAYGLGANPIITGFNNVTSWNDLGSNIWESSDAVSSLVYTNMVAINGLNTAMGRYPNTSYNTIKSTSSNSITDPQLIDNWSGANVVIKENRWTIDNCSIISQSGGTLIYSPNSGYPAIAGFGYFIQNSPKTLDQQGEWYYNPFTKKLRIYSLGMPSNVQISTVQNLVSITGMAYLTFSNLTFEGSNTATFKITNSSTVTIQNCSINFSGLDAINAYSSPFLSVLSCSIANTNNCAIYAGSYSNYGDNATISNNLIKNTGLLPGMGNATSYGYYAISTEGNSSTIQNNEIDSTGFIGIRFDKNSALINQNFVNYFCLVADDGAGIYTYHGDKDPNIYTNRRVTNNIVLNGLGCSAGTDISTQFLSDGIYMDDGVANVVITGNSVANCSDKGIHIHNTHDITLWNNTVFNSGTQLVLNEDQISSSQVRNIDIKYNILVSALVTQYILEYRTAYNDLSSFFVSDNNYFTRPLLESNAFSIGVGNGGPMGWSSYDLPGFQNYFQKDANTKKAPIGIRSVDNLKFVYNATSSTTTSPLDASYIDVKNNSYNGSITLQPYTSAILIYSGPSTKSTLQLNLISESDVSCSGGNDGKIQVSATGGSAPYTYNINYGPFNKNNLFSNLSPGNYLIFVRDNNGSQTSVQVTVGGGIGGCGAFQLSVLRQTDASCSGGFDGSVQVGTSGGAAPYTYNINYGIFSSNNSFSNLAAGSYIFYAKDNNGLQTSIPVTIGGGAKACGTLSLDLINETDPNCLGGMNGNIHVNAYGGTPPYTYNINYGLFSSNNNFNNVNAGSYIIYAQDKNGLQSPALRVKVNDGLISCPFQLNLANKSDISCQGGSDGSINVIPTGGTSPYTYNINYGLFSGNSNFNNLSAGLYVIYAHDSNGQEAQALIETLTDGTVSCNLASTQATSLSNNISISQASQTNNQLIINVAPNPTRDVFTLLIKSGSIEPVNFQVVDVNSKIVYQSIGKLNAPNTFGSSLSSGMYFIRVQQGANVQTTKVMKIK